MKQIKWMVFYWALFVASLGGCRSEEDPPLPSLRTIVQPVEAYCAARVVYPSEGREVLVDVEEDYLPHVITCENGNADYEALKAQAVAARSYLYYRMKGAIQERGVSERG